MIKERKKLGLGLLPVAALFLFNPPLGGFVDLLPDFIGYLLLFLGLRNLGDMNYHIEEALIGIRRMMVVSGCQMLSILWLFGFCSPKERPVSILLMVFTVSVLEILFAVRAFHKMFEGFLYLGSRHGSTSVFAQNNLSRSPKNETEKIATLTSVFLICKALFSTLPEFAALTIGSYNDHNPLWFLYDYISLLRIFSMLILLPLPLIWLVKFCKYIRTLLRDEPFLATLTEKYRAEVLPKEDIFLKRAIRIGTVILSIGIILSLDIYIDYISVFPDFLCPIVLLFGFFALKPYLSKDARFPIFAVANTLTSAVVYFYSIYFYDHFTMSLALFSEKALLAYYTFCILKIVDQLFFLAMVLSLLPAFGHIIENYTGFAPLDAGNFHIEDKILYVHETLNKRVKILRLLSILCAVGSIFYILFVRTLAFAWWVEFLTCLTLVLYFTSTLRVMTDEVDAKYLLS